MDKYCCRILFTCLHYLVHGSEDRSSAQCPMCPYTIVFGAVSDQKDFSHCTTHVNELQFTNFTLESCSFTRCYWLTAYSSTSPLQLIRGNPPSISHLRKFGSASRVPISPPQRTSWAHIWGIYVGYRYPSITQYLETPHKGCIHSLVRWLLIFKEDYFQALGGDFKYHIECQEINWDFTFLLISTYSRIWTLRSDSQICNTCK